MIASSAFVLTALTMTGIYMKSNNEKQMDDGYTIDFTALEDNVPNKYQEIARNEMEEQILAEDLSPEGNLDNDLDYMPMEVGSGLVELPGLTESQTELPKEDPAVEEVQEPVMDNTPIVAEKPVAQEQAETDIPAGSTPIVERVPDAEDTPILDAGEIPADAAGILPETDEGQTAQSGQTGETQQMESNEPADRSLHYAENEGLLRPVDGEVLIPYSMDSSVYFTTLAQYKYNSALMLVAREDTPVLACAEGRVISIFENEEIGHAVTMELGDGYQLTYGQLKNITVSLNDYVEAGQFFAQVASPTKYFCTEGSNLYLRLTQNGDPVNPERLFR